MRINLSRDYLRAALCLAAIQDIRYYLNGVHVIASSGETRLVATTGEILGVWQILGDNEVDSPVSVTIPRDKVALIKKSGPVAPWLETDESGNWCLHSDGAEFPFKPVEGRFPDYTRVVVSTVSRESGLYNTDLLVAFKKAAVAMGAGRENPTLFQNGKSGPGVIALRGHPGFIGIIMPYRPTEKAPEPLIPNFVHQPLVESLA